MDDVYVSSNDPRFLISSLFDVSSQSTVEQMEGKEELHIPWGTGIVGHVAKSGHSVNIPDVYQVIEIPDLPFPGIHNLAIFCFCHANTRPEKLK